MKALKSVECGGQRMRYELPKSYSGRSIAHNRRINPMPGAKDARSKSSYSNYPNDVNRVGTMPTEPLVSIPTSPQQNQLKNVVPAASYTKLLSEYETCARQNQHLKQTLDRLMGDISQLQTKYKPIDSEYFSSPSSPSGHQPSNSYSNTPLADSQSIQSQSKGSNMTSNALQHKNSSLTRVTPVEQSQQLPKLNFFNRLRKGQRKFTPHNPQNDSQKLGAFQLAQSPEAIASHQTSVAGNEAYDSLYMRAREEQRQSGSPTWIWLVAWLLLLPVSAGMGYTFVQWMVNTDAPPPPAVVQQDE